MKKISSNPLKEALAHFSKGDLARAERSLRFLLEVESKNAQAWFLLGLIHEQRGRLNDAVICYRHALVIHPKYLEALGNLADILRRQNNLRAALRFFDSALEIAPDVAELHYRKGLCLEAMRRADEALVSFAKACELDPASVRMRRRQADLLADTGRWHEAVAAYEKLADASPEDALKIRLATLLPIIVQSNDEIGKVRSRFEASLDQLASRTLTVKDPIEARLKASFYLVYHGRDNRPSQEKLAALYERACPALTYVAPHCRERPRPWPGKKITVGIVSQYFYNHTIGAVFQGIVAKLSREHFDVTLFTFPRESDDEIRRFIRSRVEHWVELPYQLPAAREAIARRRLDVLFYTDIGMDHYTYFLAFARLAPVQCTTWGHPVTTGIRNMDYYISCRAFEPGNNERCYSESLVLLDAPPTYFYRPIFPPRTPRSAYGLPDDANLYLCPQTLYKFHPDFDALLGGVLRADPKGLIVLVSSKHAHWTELLLNRLQRSIPDVAQRIQVIPYPGHGLYLNLIAIADVMLDTLHYGGGHTSLQALSVGTPIVTLPGRYQRGRHTYGYYVKMGYLECVARDEEDYRRIAVRLGTDKAWRAKVSAEIIEKNLVLFEDGEVVRQLEQRFIEMVQKAASG